MPRIFDDEDDSLIDNDCDSQQKPRFAQHRRQQITFGIPTTRDEAGLHKLAKRLRAGQLVVKLFLPYQLQA
jgi:hypothetical protein